MEETTKINYMSAFGDSYWVLSRPDKNFLWINLGHENVAEIKLLNGVIIEDYGIRHWVAKDSTGQAVIAIAYKKGAIEDL